MLRPRATGLPSGLLAAAIAFGLACVASQKAAPLPGNLLVAGQVQADGVPHAERLVDGIAAHEGDYWDTGITSRFDRPDGQVTWDLGAPQALRCLLVQGDNNDVYQFEGSDDGHTFAPLWQGEPVSQPGMRLRTGQIDKTARYLRLTASGGDHFYSLGEVAAFSQCPAGWPDVALVRADGVRSGGPNEGSSGTSAIVSIAVLALGAAILILMSRRRRPGGSAGPSAHTPSSP